MIRATEYVGDEPGRPVFINPSEIACVRTYLYHSFRPPIGEVILYNGTKIRTWEDAEEIARLVKRDG